MDAKTFWYPLLLNSKVDVEVEKNQSARIKYKLFLLLIVRVKMSEKLYNFALKHY